MYNKKFLIILIIFSLIFSVGAVSASELNQTSYLGDSSDNTLDLTDLNQQKLQESLSVDLSEDNSCDIYVDENGDSLNGNGTKENPVTTLDSAWKSVNEYKEKVTVNINDGNYTIGSILQFNTSNLHINAVGNNVIIKNLYDSSNIKQSFGLINEGNGNFTMSNVIFDGSGWTRYNSATQFFTPFSNGNSNLIKFDNCTFTGFDASKNSRDPNFHKTILPHSAVNGLNNYNTYEFTNCKFINYTSNSARGIGIAYNCNVTFVNCVFTAEYNEGTGMTNAKEVIFDSCWFGYNNFNDNRMFTSKSTFDGEIKLRQYMTNGLYKFTRYAIFDMSENYLGDNVYEIVGKLMWNDTTVDNIDKLGSMTVYLSANNGDIPKTATLENGIFKVNYTSESDYHEITAVLDHQTIKLNNSINFTLNSPSINYGDNQNVTVTFQNNVTGTVYVIVNNKTYRTYLDDKNVTVVPIGDNLPKGTHEVVVKFESYNDNHDVISLGFNTTTISVLGKGSSLTTSPVTTTYNVTQELVATLTDGNGNVLDNKSVHIIVGTIDKTLNTTSEGKVSVDISSLVPDVYVATISFDGDDCYYGDDTTANVVVNKVVPNVVISPEGDLVPGEKLTIKVEIPYATENVTIIVNGDKNTTKLVDNTATYTIDELAQGTCYVTVLYAGDELCDFAYATDSFDVVKSTADLINELNNTIESQAKEIEGLNATVNEQTSTIESQAKEIEGLNATVNNQTSTIESQKEQIVSLNETIVEQNKTINKASNPIATNILVKDIATTATTAKYFIISLVDANNVSLVNKTVKFTVNGKTDSVVTNGSGVATVKVSYSTAGTRYYTFSFLGETGYSASIASAKVVVSKKATKLTAPKKTFKAKTKTKKVQVKLTSGKTVLKNKKVTLKVKGVTYTAKTNKKGIATFKITKLTKKGTFKYAVKFAGDKAYKAVNKNGKITIK